MQRGLLTTGTILALLAAGCSGGEGDSGPGSAAADETAIEIVGTDSFAFEPDQVSAQSGDVAVELRAEEATRHTFVIEGFNDDQAIVETEAGQTATGTVDLPAGTYTFYCDVPGHREAGMEGRLTVE